MSDTPKWMVDSAGRMVHRYFEYQYDECNEHGTYSGGPSHGEPYALCESAGRWAADDIWKAVERRLAAAFTEDDKKQWWYEHMLAELREDNP